jgi:perosamine synthetase
MLIDGDKIDLIPIDADESTWCVDIAKLIDVANTCDPDDTAILVVHNVGNIVNVPRLKSILKEHQFIEDNCEGFLGEYEDLPTGTKSLASSISFYANKTLTCGEGGAFITNDADIHALVYRQANQGQTSERYVHDILAYNYRMTNMQAALLLSQLSLREEIQQKKSNIFEFYSKNLSNKYILQKISNGTKHSHWIFSVRLKGCDYTSNIMPQCNKSFETRPMFYQMSKHKHLRKYSNIDDENVAKLLSKECFMLPSHPNLNENDLNEIVQVLNKIVE